MSAVHHEVSHEPWSRCKHLACLLAHISLHVWMGPHLRVKFWRSRSTHGRKQVSRTPLHIQRDEKAIVSGKDSVLNLRTVKTVTDLWIPPQCMQPPAFSQHMWGTHILYKHWTCWGCCWGWGGQLSSFPTFCAHVIYGNNNMKLAEHNQIKGLSRSAF